jgi:hypothetical protein
MKSNQFAGHSSTQAIERVEQVLGRKLLREYKLPKLKYKATPAATQ